MHPKEIFLTRTYVDRTFSEAHREKLRAAWEVRRQRPLSEETKERMRKAKTGLTIPVGGLQSVAEGVHLLDIYLSILASRMPLGLQRRAGR